MASLRYGAGLCLMECVRRRSKDVNHEDQQILVGDGKGPKDRLPMLPSLLTVSPKQHLEKVNILHQQEVSCKVWNVATGRLETEARS